MLQPHLTRQGFRQLSGTSLQRMAYHTLEQVVGNPRRKGINRHNPSGNGLPPLPLQNRIGHSAAIALLLYQSVENVLLAHLDGFFKIALVKKRKVQGTTLIRRPEFEQIHSLSDPCKAWTLHHHGANADFFIKGRPSNQIALPAVFIISGKTIQKIHSFPNAKLLQLLCPGRTDSRKFCNRRIQSHCAHLLLFPLF